MHWSWIRIKKAVPWNSGGLSSTRMIATAKRRLSGLLEPITSKYCKLMSVTRWGNRWLYWRSYLLTIFTYIHPIAPCIILHLACGEQHGHCDRDDRALGRPVEEDHDRCRQEEVRYTVYVFLFGISDCALRRNAVKQPWKSDAWFEKGEFALWRSWNVI